MSAEFGVFFAHLRFSSVLLGTSTSKKPLVIILAVIGVLAIIVGILYMVAGTSLPSFLTAGSHVHKGNHLARGGVALVVGHRLPDRRLVQQQDEVQQLSAPAAGAASSRRRGSGSGSRPARARDLAR